MHVKDVNDDDNNDSVDKTGDTWPFLKGCIPSLTWTYEYLGTISRIQSLRAKRFNN